MSRQPRPRTTGRQEPDPSWPPALRTRPHRLVTVVLLVLALTGAATAGCTVAPVPSRDFAIPADVPAGVTLRFADQGEEVRTALTASGELDSLPFGVRFSNFVGGPAVLESFRADATDIGVVGDLPPVQAQVAGDDVPIVAAIRTNPNRYSFVARPGVPLRSLSDLRGLRIGYAEGTTYQGMILRALDTAGLSRHDVRLVRLQLAEVPEALRAGAIDVAPHGEPIVSGYLREHPDATALPNEGADAVPVGPNYLYAPAATLGDPGRAAAVAQLIDALGRAWAWVDAHPEEWARVYYRDRFSVGLQAAAAIISTTGPHTLLPLDDALISAHQQLVDIVWDAGELPRHVDVRAAFDRRFSTHLTRTPDEEGRP